jgi:hypothetical protein
MPRLVAYLPIVAVCIGDCEGCQAHAGDAVIGQDPLPPFHPNCGRVASR